MNSGISEAGMAIYIPAALNELSRRDNINKLLATGEVPVQNQEYPISYSRAFEMSKITTYRDPINKKNIQLQVMVEVRVSEISHSSLTKEATMAGKKKGSKGGCNK